jgi:Xaa-Pro aminopeptidase
MAPGAAQPSLASHRHLFVRHHGPRSSALACFCERSNPWVLPGVTAGELRARRGRVFASLPPHSIALFFARDVAIRTGDVPYPPRQGSLFAYLSGCLTPLHHWGTSSRWLSLLMLCNGASAGEQRTVLFVPPRDLKEEMWGGRRLAVSDAQTFFFGAERSGSGGGAAQTSELVAAPADGPVEAILAAIRSAALLRGPPGENAHTSPRDLLRHTLPPLYVDVPEGLAVHPFADVTLPATCLGLDQLGMVSASEAAAPRGHEEAAEREPRQQDIRYTHPLFIVLDALQQVEHMSDVQLKKSPPEGAAAATPTSIVKGRTAAPSVGEASSDMRQRVHVSARYRLPLSVCPLQQSREASRRPFGKLVQLRATYGGSPGEAAQADEEPSPLRRIAKIVDVKSVSHGSSCIGRAIRLYKSDADVANFVTSGIITSLGFEAAMASGNGALCSTEADVHRCILAACWAAGGGETLAYPPVVAAGANALCVHYTQNSDVTRAGDVVTVDAGAEYAGIYPTDCTRCWPCRGAPQFTPPQELLYSAVLRIQRRLLAMVRIGAMCSDLQRQCVALTRDALVELGMLSPNASESVKLRVTRAVFPHDFGHYCGIDIHERGPLAIPPRSMLTVEPGLYIPVSVDDLVARCMPSDEASAAELRRAVLGIPDGLAGVGMRVEDTLVVLPAADEDRARCLDRVLAAMQDFDGGTWLSRGQMPPVAGDSEVAKVRLLRAQQASIEGTIAEAGNAATMPGAADGGPTLSAWYPFPVIVTTAFVPKGLPDGAGGQCNKETLSQVKFSFPK